MSEIPADIMKAAHGVVESYCEVGRSTEGLHVHIACALLAEREAQRERDAKIAESFAQAWDNGKENHENPHYACMDIADAIRRGEV